jgi:hypothetical protein
LSPLGGAWVGLSETISAGGASASMGGTTCGGGG